MLLNTDIEPVMCLKSKVKTMSLEFPLQIIGMLQMSRAKRWDWESCAICHPSHILPSVFRMLRCSCEAQSKLGIYLLPFPGYLFKSETVSLQMLPVLMFPALSTGNSQVMAVFCSEVLFITQFAIRKWGRDSSSLMAAACKSSHRPPKHSFVCTGCA